MRSAGWGWPGQGGARGWLVVLSVVEPAFAFVTAILPARCCCATPPNPLNYPPFLTRSGWAAGNESFRGEWDEVKWRAAGVWEIVMGCRSIPFESQDIFDSLDPVICSPSPPPPLLRPIFRRDFQVVLHTWYTNPICCGVLVVVGR